MLNAFRVLFFFLIIGGCGNKPPVKQASYSVADYQRPVDSKGYYQFAGFRFKGPLHNGNPHGRGDCLSSSYSDGPCEFVNGVRVDQEHVKVVKEEISDEIAYRKQEAKEKAAREHEEDARRSAEKQKDKERDLQALRYVAANIGSVAPSPDRNSNARVPYAQLQSQAEEKPRSESTKSQSSNNSQSTSPAANTRQPAKNIPSVPSGMETPSYGLNSNARLSSSNAGESKKSTAETRTIVIDRVQSECYSLQSTAEKQNEVRAELDAGKQCRAYGQGWGPAKMTFGGHSVCESCPRARGEYACTLTGAKFNCSHK